MISPRMSTVCTSSWTRLTTLFFPKTFLATFLTQISTFTTEIVSTHLISLCFSTKMATLELLQTKRVRAGSLKKRSIIALGWIRRAIRIMMRRRSLSSHSLVSGCEEGGGRSLALASVLEWGVSIFILNLVSILYFYLLIYFHFLQIVVVSYLYSICVLWLLGPQFRCW